MGSIGLLILVVALTVFSFVIALAPTFLLRPVMRLKLWELRDQIFDARREGALPLSHHAPISLMERIEGTIAVSDELTLVRVIAGVRVMRSIPEHVKVGIDELISPNLEGLSISERDSYIEFERRYRFAIVSMPFVGSWLGLLALTVAGLLSPIWGIVSLLSTTFQTKGRVKISEQRILTEEVAIELRNTPRARQLVSI